jgi:hypothetical protein
MKAGNLSDDTEIPILSIALLLCAVCTVHFVQAASGQRRQKSFDPLLMCMFDCFDKNIKNRSSNDNYNRLFCMSLNKAKIVDLEKK